VTLEDIMSGKLPPEPAPPAEAAVPAAALATTAPSSAGPGHWEWADPPE
jgi:hypothetical protein